ncbi:unnamed protein product [Parnassius mnemosyne]|uniref:Reverse transcriptase domain-containing protein n=1 Tax=Parnassius mnemosyne TaxID=213953 RepID=A0AAV1LGA9_9NEOP
MGWLHVEKPAALLAKEFSGVVIRSAEEGLGERRLRGSGGYEWWTFELDKTRKLQCKLRRAWQSKRRLGGRSEELARMAFHSVRARYRKMMVEAQQSQHRKIANAGNEDPWGFAYRLSSGRVRPPANVINGIAFAGVHPDGLEAAMHKLMSALCPDDSTDCDSPYHRQVCLLAAFMPSGGAAPPLKVEELGGIVKALPNTAPGLDGISPGAFDNACWPMMMVKAKRGGCPPNIYRMFVDYFTSRRVGLYIGDRVEWKTSTMGCPQGSVLGPTLWNVLMNDLLRLPLPEGVAMTAYADDVTILIVSGTRAGIESRARVTLDLVREWGLRNRLEFSSSKSTTMTVRGKLQRPPVIKLGGESITTVTNVKVLGVVLDSGLSFVQHASDISERATKGFGKMSRVSTSS